MIDISVIIPVYNVEQYLEACLESALKQTKQNIEIICVNDGSKDRSPEILKKYEEKYPQRIQVILQENQGLSVARNVGVKHAKGKYIAFLDSDDEFEVDLLEKLWKKVEEYPYDVVAFDTNWIYPDHNLIVSSAVQSDKQELTQEDKKKFLIDLNVMAGNKLYKKELFEKEDLHFVPNTWFEDVLFTYKLIPNLKSIGCISDAGYRYYQRENSITYTYSDRLNEINGVLDKILAYYQKEGIYDVYQNELEYIFIRYSFATYIKRLSKAKDKKKFKEGVSYVQKRVKEKFPNYRENPYLKNGGKSFYLKNFNPFFAKLIYLFEKNKMN